MNANSKNTIAVKFGSFIQHLQLFNAKLKCSNYKTFQKRKKNADMRMRLQFEIFLKTQLPRFSKVLYSKTRLFDILFVR